MFCTECGAPLEESQPFCSSCGMPARQPGSPAQPSRAVPVPGKVPAFEQTPHKITAILWTAVGAVSAVTLVVLFFWIRSSGRVLVSKTIDVSQSRVWNPTGIFLRAGARFSVSASGTIPIGYGVPPMSPAGRPPNCRVWVSWQGFPAPQLPCWSLIGRLGERGQIFYVGKGGDFRAPVSGQLFLAVNENMLYANGNAWPAVVKVASGVLTIPTGSTGPGLEAIRAAVFPGRTYIQLPAGRFYVYGMATGGAAPAGTLGGAHHMQAVDAAGNVSAALAYGTNNANSFTTQTGYYVIGGAAIDGPWTSVRGFYGSNTMPGASDASVSFSVPTSSLVVVMGLASSQQSVTLSGIPGLTVDASSSGPNATEGLVIAHAYLRPGNYTATERSAALSAGQDPAHMVDLLGVHVFSVASQ